MKFTMKDLSVTGGQNWLLPGLLFLLLTHHSVFAADTFMVPMRDGVKLGTDVFLPEGKGPWPVILLRFPYNKALAAGIGPDAARRGYVFVAQDTRGRFSSEGANLPFDADGQADNQWDGFDTAEWITAQPWCNGRIGTWGASAGAVTQYFLAGTGHSAITSQHLIVGTPSLFREGIYRGGIFRKAMVEDWLKGTKYEPRALDLWTQNYPYSKYWTDREIVQHYGKVNAAGMHIGGWYDIFAQATLDAFQGYQNEGGPRAKGRQKLVMGPWTHGVLQKKAGDLQFPEGDKPTGEMHDPWKWFDATLRNEADGIPDGPAVIYYTMGAAEPDSPGNVWRTAGQWPPVPTTPTALYLRADRTASLSSGGAVSELSYSSDPENPVPSVGGYELTIPAGPKDQQAIENRSDLLVFTTDELEQPLEITGNAIANLKVKTSTPDADVIVRLCDVYPDGRSYNICEGALRLRFREGLDREVLMPANEFVSASVSLWPTSMIFNKGHRIRVHIASSSFPALEPNRQNGQAPRAGDFGKSDLTFAVGSEQSHLVLPVASAP